jgi:hypothetical protein
VATQAAYWITLLGMVMGFMKLVMLAILAFSIITLFQVITLPVEYDASRRAKEQLLRLGLVHPHESEAVRQVLNAAALTYVAAMVSAVLQLARFIFIARNERD